VTTTTSRLKHGRVIKQAGHGQVWDSTIAGEQVHVGQWGLGIGCDECARWRQPIWYLFGEDEVALAGIGEIGSSLGH
jgi:hypothetical protein